MKFVRNDSVRSTNYAFESYPDDRIEIVETPTRLLVYWFHGADLCGCASPTLIFNGVGDGDWPSHEVILGMCGRILSKRFGLGEVSDANGEMSMDEFEMHLKDRIKNANEKAHMDEARSMLERLGVSVHGVSDEKCKELLDSLKTGIKTAKVFSSANLDLSDDDELSDDGLSDVEIELRNALRSLDIRERECKSLRAEVSDLKAQLYDANKMRAPIPKADFEQIMDRLTAIEVQLDQKSRWII